MTRATAAAVLLLLADACVMPGNRAGRPLSGWMVRKIVPGQATKADLLSRLGAPIAIAVRGEHVQVPATTVHHQDAFLRRSAWLGGGSYVQQADAWFELFAARRPIRDTHRVYYWYTTSDRGLFAWPILFIVETHGSSSVELWALVDEATGAVDDVFTLRD